MVSERAQKALSALFYAKSSEARRQVAWQEFLWAMGSLGFEIQAVYGSCWQFVPPPTIGHPGARPTQFHSPHPESKVPSNTARRWGRRLAIAYGWNMEMFAVKQ
jgi:hypothetical protein